MTMGYNGGMMIPHFPLLVVLALVAIVMYVAWPSGTTGLLFGIFVSGPIVAVIVGWSMLLLEVNEPSHQFAAYFGSTITGAVVVLTVVASTMTGSRRGKARLERDVRSIVRRMPRQKTT